MGGGCWGIEERVHQHSRSLPAMHAITAAAVCCATPGCKQLQPSIAATVLHLAHQQAIQQRSQRHHARALQLLRRQRRQAGPCRRRLAGTAAAAAAAAQGAAAGLEIGGGCCTDGEPQADENDASDLAVCEALAQQEARKGGRQHLANPREH